MFRKNIFYLHWFLLIYVIAGFTWWYIIIYNQSEEIANLKFKQTHSQEFIEKYKSKKQTQYLGEGVVLLSIILAGSFFIYGILKREFYINKKEKNFLLGITHELKTPITTILLNLETLQLRKCNEELKNNLINNSIAEIKRLDNFYDNIMMSAYFEENNLTLNTTNNINIPNLIKQLINKYKQRNIDIDVKFNNTKNYVLGDEHLLMLCFDNIINNAIKYSSTENRKISIISYHKNNKIILEFADNGIGIPEQEKRNVFYKFYRIEAEHTRKTKGSGLGLFIVKQIIKRHEGRIILLNNHPQGTIVKIIFNEKK